MSSKPNGSPPPYEEGQGYYPQSQPAYSYYPDDEFQHFYRWTSPPGILKIMAIIVIVLSVGIFACVASTLAYDNSNAMAGFGGYNTYGGGSSFGGGYSGGSYGGGSYGGYGSGYGSNYNDPRQGKGFMIAIAIISFILGIAVFVILVSHNGTSRSRKFYLAVVIVCAVMALMMLIATIVYLMAVNPSAQSSGSMYGNMIAGLCAQYQQPQIAGQFVNQYLYHYCVVEPQEAIAIVFGFLVTAAFVIMLVFALKTRQKIMRYDKENILWRKVRIVEEEEAPPLDVAHWVNDVAAPAEASVTDYPEKRRGSTNYLDQESNYDKPPSSYIPQPAVESQLLSNGAPHSSSSEIASSFGAPKRKRPGRPRRANGQEYDTDYNSSGDELDDDDFDGEFPPVKNEQERNDYKREFDRDHHEYKELQAELDSINRKLSDLDRELDELQEGSPQYLDVLDEYNRMRGLKKTPDYQVKKRRCKYLKGKLSHIKKMVADFDRRA